MSISEAIESYDRLARTVFSDAKRFSNEKFKATKLEEVLKEIIRHKTRNVDEPMMDPRPEKEACKTYVPPTALSVA